MKQQFLWDACGCFFLWVPWGWDEIRDQDPASSQQSLIQKSRAGTLCPIGKGSSIHGDGAIPAQDLPLSPPAPSTGVGQQLQQCHRSLNVWAGRGTLSISHPTLLQGARNSH